MALTQMQPVGYFIVRFGRINTAGFHLLVHIDVEKEWSDMQWWQTQTQHITPDTVVHHPLIGDPSKRSIHLIQEGKADVRAVLIANNNQKQIRVLYPPQRFHSTPK